ncbi:MAG: TetR/AcrR family transcriptional regulator [Eubacteriaceae bacterium]
MRVVKEPEERRNEILDAAEKLFVTKGYTKTTIINILDAIGIAKGTFYYYFKSKEAVLDAVIRRIVQVDVALAKEIAKKTEIGVIEKIFYILLAQQSKIGEVKYELIQEFHESGNAEMHQKSIVETVFGITPVLTEVIEQGIQEKVFHMEYPKETVEFLLVAAEFIFDSSYFKWTPEERAEKVKAFIFIMERLFGAEKNSFEFMAEILKG